MTGSLFAAIIPICLTAVIVGKKMRKINEEMQNKKAEISQIVEESFSNIRTVKAFASE
jgi:ABC-type multidrug transport system fused ATPase/permease subunit